MFKYFVFVIFASLAATASIGMTEEQKFVPILMQAEEKNADGSFAFFYEGADGGKREEVAQINNPGTEDEKLVVKGSYRYIDTNGEEVVVEYIADENGFQPQGSKIPKEISEAAHDAALRSTMERQQTN